MLLHVEIDRHPRIGPLLDDAAGLAGGPAGLSHIFAAQPIEPLEPGKALFWQGDGADHLFEIAAGALRRVRVLSDGRRVVTGFLFAGDMVGLSAGPRYLTTVEAIAPTGVRRLTRRRFDEMLERSPTLHPAVLAQLCDEMVGTQEQIVLLARKTADERVATFLLALARRAGICRPGMIIALPMSRLDIADYLGLTIETVSRAITRLIRRGIIAASGRHALAIVRPTALAVLAVDDEAGETLAALSGRAH